RIEETEEYLDRLVRIFGRSHVYFELILDNSERERTITGRMVQLAEFLGLGVVATNNVHYLCHEDEAAFLCISRNQSILDAAADRPFGEILSSPEYTSHLADTDAMKEKFRAWPTAIENTVRLAGECDFSLPDLRSRPKTRQPLHDFVRGRDADSFIWDLVFEEAALRFGELSANVKNRLNEEFDAFKKAGMENYLVFLYRLGKYLNEKSVPFILHHDEIITSLTGFLLNLTEIDPLKYQIRFQAPSMDDTSSTVASFDLPASAIAECVRWIRGMFPAGSIAEMGMFQNWTRAALLNHIASWARLSAEESQHLARESARQRDLDLEQSRKYIRANSISAPLNSIEFLNTVFTLLHPRPKNLTPRTGILAFGAKDLEALLPCEEQEGGIIVSQFDEDVARDFGLHRICITPDPILDILDNAVGWVRSQGGNPNFSLDRVDLADDRVFDILSQGLSEGIPPFESITFKSLLRKAHPRSFLELNVVLMEYEENLPAFTRERRSSVAARLIRCLLGFRCAFIKAHYPSSFMTAALTQAFNAGHGLDRFTALLRQIKRLGITILPPRINESLFGFTQEGENIRTGLMVVKRLGENTAEHIVHVRKSGPFHSLADLCRRTDARLLTPGILENLTKAGALDSFNLKRSQIMGILKQIVSLSRDQKKNPDATESLFGEPEQALVDQTMEIPEFSPDDLMKLEQEVAGYIVTRYPLEPYQAILDAMGAVPRADLNPKQTGVIRYLGGFIDHIDSDGPLIRG
ncbi:MAG TPA: hypothetical protein PLB62_12585, partial [Candidatus Sumerlaeota bacterium]|nr:hypothetical protein [Candidatus Sumerlaeota bacterium]